MQHSIGHYPVSLTALEFGHGSEACQPLQACHCLQRNGIPRYRRSLLEFTLGRLTSVAAQKSTWHWVGICFNTRAQISEWSTYIAKPAILSFTLLLCMKSGHSRQAKRFSHQDWSIQVPAWFGHWHTQSRTWIIEFQSHLELGQKPVSKLITWVMYLETYLESDSTKTV